MNTGGQRSGATPVRAATTTDPAGRQSMGKAEMKKDLPEIIAAHGIDYVATASVAYLRDLKKKIKAAMSYQGPRYIQIDTPCPSVWSFASHLTLEIGRMGVNCGLVPLFEKQNGAITAVRKIKKKIPVAEYLKQQKRYSHLFASEQGLAELKKLQTVADRNIEKYGLMKTA
jgi:pyruvate ferredoxin oxidoreductase beta subunit